MKLKSSADRQQEAKGESSGTGTRRAVGIIHNESQGEGSRRPSTCRRELASEGWLGATRNGSQVQLNG